LQAINSKIDEVLETASNQNAILNHTLKAMGVSPKPTVSEWIKQKQEQKKTKVQNSLISWDIYKSRREEAIKMKQLLTYERATRHAAWETEKNIQQKIKSLRNRRIEKSGSTNTATHSPLPSSAGIYV